MFTQTVKRKSIVPNGTHGTKVAIVLNADEPRNGTERCMWLRFLPEYILVKLDHTRLPALEGLPQGMGQIFPTTKSFIIRVDNQKTKTVERKQYPTTPVYTITDVRAQEQTIPHIVVDIALAPRMGTYSIFNVYMAPLRSSSRRAMRILRKLQDSTVVWWQDDRFL